jgi:tetratricopeptide (TPR) repeat protein
MRGDLDGAERMFAGVAERSSDDLRRAEAWEALGVIRFSRGDMPGSLAAYYRAQPLYEATRGPAYPSVGLLQSNIGESLAASGDQRGALDAFAEALQILERALPADHPDLALPYKGRGQVRLALGERDAALADLERALALHEANPNEPIEHADVEFTLARALFDAGEPTRARALATSAEQRLLELGHTGEAAEVSTWIHDHTRTHD